MGEKYKRPIIPAHSRHSYTVSYKGPSHMKGGLVEGIFWKEMDTGMVCLVWKVEGLLEGQVWKVEGYWMAKSGKSGRSGLEY